MKKPLATRAIGPAALVLAVALLAGCASGPSFQAVETPPAGQAQVYVYRPWQVLGGGMSHRIIVDGSPDMLSLPNRSWQRVVLTPGRHTFGMTNAIKQMGCNTITLDLGAGQTAYIANGIDTTVPIGSTVHLVCRMTVKEASVALQEMDGLPRAD